MFSIDFLTKRYGATETVPSSLVNVDHIATALGAYANVSSWSVSQKRPLHTLEIVSFFHVVKHLTPFGLMR